MLNSHKWPLRCNKSDWYFNIHSKITLGRQRPGFSADVRITSEYKIFSALPQYQTNCLLYPHESGWSFNIPQLLAFHNKFFRHFDFCFIQVTHLEQSAWWWHISCFSLACQREMKSYQSIPKSNLSIALIHDTEPCNGLDLWMQIWIRYVDRY